MSLGEPMLCIAASSLARSQKGWPVLGGFWRDHDCTASYLLAAAGATASAAALVALGCRVGEGAARETHAWHLRIENGGRPDEARRRPPSPGGRLVTGKRWHNVRA